MDEPRKATKWWTSRYDWNDGVEPTTAVVKAVAAATGRQPTDLPTLYDRLDTDALDDLLDRGDGGAVEVAFEYAGVDVRVGSDGTVAVRLDER